MEAALEGGWAQGGGGGCAVWGQEGDTPGPAHVPATGGWAHSSHASPARGPEAGSGTSTGSQSEGEAAHLSLAAPAALESLVHCRGLPGTPGSSLRQAGARRGTPAAASQISDLLERCRRASLSQAPPGVTPPPVYPPQVHVHPPLLHLPLTQTLELCHELESGQMLLVARAQESGGLQVLVDGCLVQEVCPGCTAVAFHEPSRLLALHFSESNCVELYRFAENCSWVEFTGARFDVTVTGQWGGPVTERGLAGTVSWMGFAEIETESGRGEMQGFESDTDETGYDETVLFGAHLHLIVLDRDSLAVLAFPVGEAVPAYQAPRALALGTCEVSKGVVVPGGTHLLLLAAPLPVALPAQRHQAQVVTKQEALRCMKESSTRQQPLLLHVVCLLTMSVVKEIPLPFCHGSLSDWELGISSSQDGALSIVLLQNSTGKLSFVPYVLDAHHGTVMYHGP